MFGSSTVHSLQFQYFTRDKGKAMGADVTAQNRSFHHVEEIPSGNIALIHRILYCAAFFFCVCNLMGV